MSLALSTASKRPTRVLHVVGSMNRGGVETWLMTMLRNVSRDELAFDFMVHKAEIAVYDAELLALGARRYVCEGSSNPLVYARNFLKILRQHGPYDVIHSHVHHFSGFVLLLAKLAGVPIRIAHSHSDTSAAQQTATGLRSIYLKGTEQLVRYAATSGIAGSAKAASSLFRKDWRQDQRWKVIYTGIDLKAFAAPVNRPAKREELGISDSALVVIHVGRFDKVKNHEFLIDIFEKIVDINSDSCLVLVGIGKLKNKIEEKVKSLDLQNRVIFAGSRDDLFEVLKVSDIFVMPSFYEGLPLSGIEAQAADLPLVTSDSVTEELFLNRDNNIQISLGRSADFWAIEIIRISNLGNSETAKSLLGSHFDIDVNIALIKNEYGLS